MPLKILRNSKGKKIGLKVRDTKTENIKKIKKVSQII